MTGEGCVGPVAATTVCPSFSCIGRTSGLQRLCTRFALSADPEGQERAFERQCHCHPEAFALLVCAHESPPSESQTDSAPLVFVAGSPVVSLSTDQLAEYSTGAPFWNFNLPSWGERSGEVDVRPLLGACCYRTTWPLLCHPGAMGGVTQMCCDDPHWVTSSTLLRGGPRARGTSWGHRRALSEVWWRKRPPGY